MLYWKKKGGKKWESQDESKTACLIPVRDGVLSTGEHREASERSECDRLLI
jgi:hypothetical protein